MQPDCLRLSICISYFRRHCSIYFKFEDLRNTKWQSAFGSLGRISGLGSVQKWRYSDVSTNIVTVMLSPGCSWQRKYITKIPGRNHSLMQSKLFLLLKSLNTSRKHLTIIVQPLSAAEITEHQPQTPNYYSPNSFCCWSHWTQAANSYYRPTSFCCWSHWTQGANYKLL